MDNWKVHRINAQILVALLNNTLTELERVPPPEQDFYFLATNQIYKRASWCTSRPDLNIFLGRRLKGDLLPQLGSLLPTLGSHHSTHRFIRSLHQQQLPGGL